MLGSHLTLAWTCCSTVKRWHWHQLQRRSFRLLGGDHKVNSSLKITTFIIIITRVYYTCGCTCCREQLEGASSFLPQCGSLGFTLGCQVWWQVANAFTRWITLQVQIIQLVTEWQAPRSDLFLCLLFLWLWFCFKVKLVNQTVKTIPRLAWEKLNQLFWYGLKISSQKNQGVQKRLSGYSWDQVTKFQTTIRQLLLRSVQLLELFLLYVSMSLFLSS